MVKKRLPLYQKMLSFTYCKWPLLYHRKFSLTQLRCCSYIIGSSPLTQCRQPLLCKRVLSQRYECGRIYIKGHSLYLLWEAAPISILNNEGGHPFTSAHFQKAATSSFYFLKGICDWRGCFDCLHLFSTIFTQIQVLPLIFSFFYIIFCYIWPF